MKPEGVINTFVAELKSNPIVTTMVIPHGVSMEEYIENHLDPLWWIDQN
jgi:hypothetical protein